ncbi:hypothetical protein PROFUN_05804 [Planoprotostelium fungivorum]|uniref:At2g23090-like zinc-binding domain-containing protein n=1 Tax=Planoprotostelium fungivorum TaxID=1890364 RepID=A0A2P6NQ12_9EUKA|nr:hypothetical protein PROFUN_05804 [Planoprotostelium fungivorum]
MPQSKKDLRKAKQKENAAAGVVYQKKEPERMAKCQKCKLDFRATKRNVELLSHATAKHSDSTFTDCFPGEVHE